MIDPASIDAIPIFTGLNPEARRELASRGAIRRFAKGRMLWNAGDAPTGLHVLLEGEVRVIRIVGGRQHVVHTERAGGTLGDVPLFDGSTYPATAIAATSCVCAVFSRDTLFRAIERDARLAFVLLARLAGRVRHVIGRLDGASARTVTERLARYLLDRAAGSPAASMTLGGTQSDVAEDLGTVREVLVRGLRELREAGLIAPAGRGRIRIVDPARLRRLARP